MAGQIQQATSIYFDGPDSNGKYHIVDQDGFHIATCNREADARWIVQSHRRATEQIKLLPTS